MPTGELLRATPLHFVSFAEEVPRTVINVTIDGFIRRGKAAIGEVRGPTAQEGDDRRLHTPRQGRHRRSTRTNRPGGGSVASVLRAKRPCCPVSAARRSSF